MKGTNGKWRWAIGTTSRVPLLPGKHYLMLDYDDRQKHPPSQHFYIFGNHGFVNYEGLFFPAVWEPTRHGTHVYTGVSDTFDNILKAARSLGADKNWLKIGERRGYLFLAHKRKIRFPWPVEHMAIDFVEEPQ